MKNIVVFCSALDLPEKYIRPTEEFARLIALHGYSLVWGGSDTGLMKVIAKGVREGGGKLIGVSIDLFKHVAHASPDEMTIAKDLGERKTLMMQKGDAIVMLPGGTGTLDEITDMIEHRKNKLHDKPIVILNIDHFYDGFQTQLFTMRDEGFLHRPLDELVFFAKSPEEAITYIEKQIGKK